LAGRNIFLTQDSRRIRQPERAGLHRRGFSGAPDDWYFIFKKLPDAKDRMVHPPSGNH
jgi:hypothetical protein